MTMHTAARIARPTTTALRQARSFSSARPLAKEIQDAYILSAARTPTASVSIFYTNRMNESNRQFNGSFVTVPAPELGATAIKSAISRSKVPADKITDVYMGNVLQGSVGQAPARQASIFAGLSPNVEAMTVNKVCASGLKAVALAAQNIQLGLAQAQVAGGMENMSRVPYYLPRSSQLPPFGELKMEDGLIKDGLWDVYNQFHMGICAEQTAKKYDVTREDQDAYAIRSYERAQQAWKENKFAKEITPVTVKGRKGDTVIERDEGFDTLRVDKMPTLKPAFLRDGTGTVTAGNASTMNDGASALVIGSKDLAREFGKGNDTLARIVSSADAAVDPVDFPVAPAKAVPIALERAGITKEQVSVWEFNEAFAAVIKANEKVSYSSFQRRFTLIFRSSAWKTPASTSGVAPSPSATPWAAPVPESSPLSSTSCSRVSMVLRQSATVVVRPARWSCRRWSRSTKSLECVVDGYIMSSCSSRGYIPDS